MKDEERDEFFKKHPHLPKRTPEEIRAESKRIYDEIRANQAANAERAKTEAPKPPCRTYYESLPDNKKVEFLKKQNEEIKEEVKELKSDAAASAIIDDAVKGYGAFKAAKFAAKKTPGPKIVKAVSGATVGAATWKALSAGDDAIFTAVKQVENQAQEIAVDLREELKDRPPEKGCFMM